MAAAEAALLVADQVDQEAQVETLDIKMLMQLPQVLHLPYKLARAELLEALQAALAERARLLPQPLGSLVA